MEFEKIITAVIIFTIFIVGGTLMFDDMQNNYSTSDVDMDLEEYTDIQEVSETEYSGVNKTIQDMDTNMFTQQSDNTDTQQRLWGSTFSTLELLRNTPKIVWNIVNTISLKLGIPKIFIDGVLMILVVGFIFMIVYILFGVWKG